MASDKNTTRDIDPDVQDVHHPGVSYGVRQAIAQGDTLEADAAGSAFAIDPRPAGIEAHLHQQALRSRLLGVSADPVRIGHFIILDKLGEGTAGTVFSAYDEQLDRRVAVKVLPSRDELDFASKQPALRFLRETRALARLSHVNVVRIYEAGEYEQHLYIAMELVTGQTLQTWLARNPKAPLTDLLPIFVQLGQGLAAAHRAGVIHRDFKPANVLIGDDGVPQIADFGLARLLRPSAASQRSDDDDDDGDGDPDSADSADSESSDDHSDAGGSVSRTRLPEAAITATGAVLGTPRYMAPEQYRGERVDGRSDQFSFCVVLWEAIYRRPPFVGRSLFEIQAAIARGPTAAPAEALTAASAREPAVATTTKAGAKVPKAVHQMLLRGLAANPADRFDNMEQIVAVLQHQLEPRRRPQRLALTLAAVVAVVVAVVVAIGAAALWFLSPSVLGLQPVSVCAGARQRVAEIWDPQRRASLHGRIRDGAHHAYAAEAWPHLADAVTAYAADWATMHRSACLAHRRGEQSDLMLDKRMACLERSLLALRDALEALSDHDDISAAAMARTQHAMAKLPALARCADLAALAAAVPPPETPAIAAQVRQLRAQLIRAQTLANLGRTDLALEAASQTVADAKSVPHPPVLAEALLHQGRIMLALHGSARVAAGEPLHEALLLGLEHGLTSLAVEALARYLFSRGTSSRDPAVLLPLVPVAEALSKQSSAPSLQTSPHRTFARALLLNNIGTIYTALGTPDEAEAYFQRALAVTDGAPGDIDIELVNIWKNLALTTADASLRASLWQQITSEFERRLGRHHPLTLDARDNHSRQVISPHRAFTIAEPACVARERLHPYNHRAIEDCLYYVAFLEAELGQDARASRRMERLAGRLADRLAGRSADGPSRRLAEDLALARGFARYYQSDYRAAAASFRAQAQAERLAAERWWQRVRPASLYLGLGVSELGLGRYRAARIALEHVLPVLEDLVEVGDSAEDGHRLAWARFALAQALWHEQTEQGNIDRHRDQRRRALELAAQAEAWYRRTGSGHAWRIEDIAQWRHEWQEPRRVPSATR